MLGIYREQALIPVILSAQIQLGDSVGESTARMNVSDLRKMLGLGDADGPSATGDESVVTAAAGDGDNASAASGETATASATASADATMLEPHLQPQQPSIRSNGSSTSSARHFRVRRQSMEQLDLIKVSLSSVLVF